MVNPALGPDHDLAQRLARLESQVASLSTNVFASEMPFPASAIYTSSLGVTTSSTSPFPLWEAVFPLRHPFLAFTLWVTVPTGTLATIEVDAGPNSMQGLLVDSTVTFTVDGTQNGFTAPYYAGLQNLNGGNNALPAMSLGGDPSQYGAAWGISISASVNTGSVTVQSPMLFGRFTQ